MSKCLVLLLPFTILVGFASCSQRSNHSADGNRTPDSSDGPQDTWNALKPISKMLPYEGSWEGETFAKTLFNSNGKLKSGAELRTDISKKSRMSLEERRKSETWYKIRLVIARKDLQLGETAPYNAKLVMETNSPNLPATRSESTCHIRIRNDNAIELRATSISRVDYVVRIDKSESETQRLDLESSDLKIGGFHLHKVDKQPPGDAKDGQK